MSTYYDYRNVGVMIAHKLMKMEGWKVYGYKADHSDMMTDYWDPAYWGGVAEKNGYVFCFNVHRAEEQKEIRRTNYSEITKDISDKIKKLSEMTVERGATEAEEETAKRMIEKLLAKQNESISYETVEIIPGHLENPPRCNWHLEKDGVIIEKGSGMLKYSKVDDFYRYDRYEKELEAFRNDEAKFKNIYMNKRYSPSEEGYESYKKEFAKKVELVDSFEAFIKKIDNLCGGMIGDEGYIYEKVIKTEYKKEYKPVEDSTGTVKEGQCFILKTNFNYCRHKGNVFKIESIDDDGKWFHAYKYNRNHTKTLHGKDNSNYFYTTIDKLEEWLGRNSIAWCHIEEVKTPYEVEKVVKKKITTEKEHKNNNKNNETASKNFTYEMREDTDTRDGSKIYLVNVKEKLSKEQYIEVYKYMKSLGGYYSKFKHAFLFKEKPELEVEITEVMTESEETAEIENNSVPEYTITEEEHSKTNEKLWVLRFENNISKEDFANWRQKFAILKGYYSSFKKGFIFKYDPKEKLELA